MKKKITALAVLLTLTLVLSACGSYNFKKDMEIPMKDFEHIDQKGDKVSLEDLKGKPWIGMYIFTNCTTVCNPMTNNMVEVQERLVKKGVEDYNIVAFSVDPERDTPEALTSYIERYPVPDMSKWHLLTGYTQKYIEDYALNVTKLLVKDDPNSDQVTHAVTFFLVDDEGTVVKNYSGYSEEENGVPLDTIAIDMETLIKDVKAKNS